MGLADCRNMTIYMHGTNNRLYRLLSQFCMLCRAIRKRGITYIFKINHGIIREGVDIITP
jgi:hypothetical protein